MFTLYIHGIEKWNVGKFETDWLEKRFFAGEMHTLTSKELRQLATQMLAAAEFLERGLDK